MTERPKLTVLNLGDLPDSSLQPLRAAGIELAVVVASSDAELSLASDGRQLNRFIDDAPSDWIVVIRQSEFLTARLAEEIADAIQSERAWGYRLLVEEQYCGKPLPASTRSAGEIRLFHRRRARFVADPGAREMLVQGTVVRLRTPLILVRHATTHEHAAQLAAAFPRRSFPGRLLHFGIGVLTTRALFRGGATLTHLWIESAFHCR